MINNFLSEYVKTLRKNANLTQDDFAKILDVNISTIVCAETGKTNLPNTKFLHSLSKYAGLDPAICLAQILYYKYYDNNMYFDWTHMNRNSGISFVNDSNLYREDKYILKSDGFIELAFALKTSYLILNSWQLIYNLAVLKCDQTAEVIYTRGKNIELIDLLDNTGNMFPHGTSQSIKCFFSVLRKSHNPTKITLITVPDSSLAEYDTSNKDKLLQLCKTIKKEIHSILNIDKYNVNITFLLNSSYATNKYEVMQRYNLTEKPNKDGFTLSFYHHNQDEFYLIDGEFYIDHQY